jgi:hypothetical protein
MCATLESTSSLIFLRDFTKDGPVAHGDPR